MTVALSILAATWLTTALVFVLGLSVAAGQPTPSTVVLVPDEDDRHSIRPESSSGAFGLQRARPSCRVCCG